jgi:protein-disulfide isomerase
MVGVHGQAAPAAKTGTTQKKPPLQLQSLTPDTVADPFPPVNPKFFTADSPSVATVESYLHAMLGYDVNRIWRVVGIQKTTAPGVSRVTALVSEKVPNAKLQQAQFFVLPDGKHLIADMQSGVLPFGADPYADNRKALQALADGPFQGSASKDLMLVEFADLQCPHCKEVQPTIKRLVEEFPKARVVYQNLPLVDLHPFAYKAAAYGVCVAKQSSSAFFSYVQAVYDTQSLLTAEEGNKTLAAAVTKAGADPAAVESCAAAESTKASIDGSVKLAQDLGINQTPVLMVNGRLIPLGEVSFETLKELIRFQAGLDGVAASAAGPSLLVP